MNSSQNSFRNSSAIFVRESSWISSMNMSKKFSRNPSEITPKIPRDLFEDTSKKSSGFLWNVSPSFYSRIFSNYSNIPSRISDWIPLVVWACSMQCSNSFKEYFRIFFSSIPSGIPPRIALGVSAISPLRNPFDILPRNASWIPPRFSTKTPSRVFLRDSSWISSMYTLFRCK